MKKLVILLIIPFIFLTSGCDNIKELNELGIVSALGFEKEGDDFLVTAQLVNTKKSGEQTSNTASKIVTFSSTGKTIFDAIRKISTKSSKKLYFPHMRIIVIDDEIINEDIIDVLDFLLRDSESMINFYVLVTKDNTPYEILKTLTPFEDVPGEYLSNSLKNSENSYGNTNLMTFEKMVSDLLTGGIEPIYTKVSLTKNTTESDKNEMLESSALDTYIKLGNLMVKNKENELEELSRMESVSVNFVRNNIGTSILTLDCEDEKYTVEIISQKTDMKYKKSELKVSFNTNAELSISDYKCKYDLNKEENIKKLEKQIEEYLKTNIDSVLKKAQEVETDFLGIGKFINSTDKKFFKKYEKNWNIEGLSKLKLESKVKAKIDMRGNLSHNKIKVGNQ